MSFRFEPRLICLAATVVCTSTILLVMSGMAGENSPTPTRRVLRVAADPNNLPFSNERLEGFENKIAALLARELKADLEYVWHAQRRGFFRETLKDGDCDLVMGVPVGFERTLNTKPYYRSSYVFVSRNDGVLKRSSLDDPALRTLKIGVHVIGADGVNTPPAHALAARGIVTNVVGYSIYGDYAEPNPPARIVEAVSKGDIDLAIVWGPLGGYFAAQQNPALVAMPVAVAGDSSDLPMEFAIAIGVRRKNKELRDEVDRILASKRAEIAHILDAYHVPRTPEPQLSSTR